MTANLVILKDDPNDAAYILGALASSGMSIAEIDDYEKAINSVSLNDIKSAVTEMLKSTSLQGEVITSDNSQYKKEKNQGGLK